MTPANIATNAITLGFAQITSNASTNSTTPVAVSGLSCAVTIPAGGRYVKVTVMAQTIAQTAGVTGTVSIWDGTVGSGTQLASQFLYLGSGGNVPLNCFAIVTPAAGSKTYNVGFQSSNASNSTVITASSGSPAILLVECC